MSAPHWSLAEAVTWMITRDDAAVAASPTALAHLSLLDAIGEGVGGDLRAARLALWEQLERDTIRATGRDDTNQRIAIPPEEWQDLEATLETGRGSDDEVLRPRAHRRRTTPGGSYVDVTVSADAVRKAWPETAEARPLAARGPKRKIDRDQIHKAVAEWVEEHGFPDPRLDPGNRKNRQAYLERYMLERCGDAISESYMRKLVREALRAIKGS
jgi:hypothetical protein